MLDQHAIRIPTPARAKTVWLCAPFDDVQFRWDASDRYIEVEYIGRAERLIECGAIEPRMTGKIRKGDPKPRRDSAGHTFHRNVKILREPLSTALHIVRRIDDVAFAETLPGFPRGLRFKRLDWLDAHPDQLCVTSTSTVRGDYTHHRKWVAGTAKNLISIAGYSKEAFGGKLLERVDHIKYLNEGEPEHKSAILMRLMRRYFEIQIETREETTCEPAPAPTRPSHLRLVVDNRAPAVRS